MDPSLAFSGLPGGLRDPLLSEYRSIVQNFSEGRWAPSELSGGLFCEIVFTILEGYAAGTFRTTPYKPGNFVMACRALEQNASVPRSFQILIPRLLPGLYEIRNNRGVGHVGGDVDPNHMDAVAVLSICNWIMAELIRVFHSLTTENAQALVDIIAERQVPLVWKVAGIRRVLDTSLKLKEQILVLSASSGPAVSAADLLKWTSYGNKSYFTKTLRALDLDRLIYFTPENDVIISPKGQEIVSKLLLSKSTKLG